MASAYLIIDPSLSIKETEGGGPARAQEIWALGAAPTGSESRAAE